MPSEEQGLTLLLRDWRSAAGNQESLDRLMPVLYDQLHRLAASCLRSERPDHTRRATALVHEAYLRLADSEIPWESRGHFYAVAARVLRHILVDYAKASGRKKRGGGLDRIPLDEAVVIGPELSSEIVELDDALKLPGGATPLVSTYVSPACCPSAYVIQPKRWSKLRFSMVTATICSMPDEAGSGRDGNDCANASVYGPMRKRSPVKHGCAVRHQCGSSELPAIHGGSSGVDVPRRGQISTATCRRSGGAITR